MSKDFWQKIEEIFPLVADLPPSEREERLRDLCTGDDDLRREISELLAADAKVGDFYEIPAVMPNSLQSAFSRSQTQKTATLELAGKKIGAYRIVRKISSGGMGAVYLAVRADGEFDKKVAVKLVKNGSDTELNLRRFRYERQILADLEHPNIARLIDGGTTASGAPYFVMEYVEGETLFDYCSARGLDLSARLQLFGQICAAVAYAHERGVIHRDLKPGNILVTESGAVKLLDFGIAKIFDADSAHYSEAQTATLTRQMTPEYASPEQIKGERITPASDVYSVGVVLYELLIGERPYKFPSRSPHEIARVICEQEVQSPRFRSENPLSDDLSFIVLKTLRKKPSERYGSVADLNRDIEKFLAGLPVAPVNERTPLFEKSLIGSEGGTASLAVAPFKVISAGGSVADTNEDFLGIGLADALTTTLSGVRQLAVRPTSSVLRLAAKNADARALGEELDVDYVLEGHILRAAEQIRVSAQLLKIKDDSILWAAQFDEAETDIFGLQDSISKRVAASLVPQLTVEEEELMRRHGTANSAAFEAYVRGRISYHTYTVEGITAAGDYFRQAIRHDPRFALAHSGLADFYNWLSIAGGISTAEGFALAKKSAQTAIELDPNLSEAYTSLGFAVWSYDWDFAEAERLYLKSIALNPNYVKAREWYAYLLSSAARHDEAIEEMRRAERLDPISPSVAAMFGFCLYNARRYAEALEKTRRALKFDPNYYLALQGLGWVCPPLGLYDEAIAGCRRAVEISDRLGFNKFSLALALAAAGQIAEAREIAAELETIKSSRHVLSYYLGVIYAVLGDFDTAFKFLDRAIEERGYWVLWMRVEPRFDNLRRDQRFIERLEKIKPLQDDKSTGELAAHPIDYSKLSKNFKTRAAFAAAVLIFLALVGALNLKNLIRAGEDSPRGIADLNNDRSQENLPKETSSPVAPSENEKPRTKDAVADGLYLAGKQQLEARTPEGVNRAIGFFSDSVKRDPEFALAFSGLADAHIVLAGLKKETASASYRKAEEYAMKALALDPDLAEARVSLAMATFRNTGNFAAAERQFLRAIEINPTLSRARHWYSVILIDAGKIEAALREIKIAVELEPRSAVIHHNAGVVNSMLKRYDEAIAYFDKTIELDRGYANAYLSKTVAQEMIGDWDGAVETYRVGRIYSGKEESEALWVLIQAQANAGKGQRGEATALLNSFFENPVYRKEAPKLSFDIAIVYSLLGDAANAYKWLEKIDVKKLKDFRQLKEDPRLANLRDDDRYHRLLEKRGN